MGVKALEPTLAVDQGGQVGCAWIAKTEDKYQIVFRERSGDTWSESVRLGGTMGVVPTKVQLIYDPLSQPHLIWTEMDASGNSRLMHSSRLSGTWVFHGVVGMATSARMSDPSVDFDALGVMHVVWREGNGSFWNIKSATIETSGTATVRPVTQGDPKLLLYPTIIGRPVPRVFWFAEEAGVFSLESRMFDEQLPAWTRHHTLDLAALPVNRLPLLFGTEGGATCGVWVDAFSGMERIFWGISGQETHGAGVLVDEAETVPGSQPSGCWSPSGPLVAWRGESAEGPLILARKYGIDGWTSMIKIPAAYPSQPRIVSTDSAAHLCWLSEANDGGDGNIYVTTLRWTD